MRSENENEMGVGSERCCEFSAVTVFQRFKLCILAPPQGEPTENEGNQNTAV
jgi:hypothetical protein